VVERVHIRLRPRRVHAAGRSDHEKIEDGADWQRPDPLADPHASSTTDSVLHQEPIFAALSWHDPDTVLIVPLRRTEA